MANTMQLFFHIIGGNIFPCACKGKRFFNGLLVLLVLPLCLYRRKNSHDGIIPLQFSRLFCCCYFFHDLEHIGHGTNINRGSMCCHSSAIIAHHRLPAIGGFSLGASFPGMSYAVKIVDNWLSWCALLRRALSGVLLWLPAHLERGVVLMGSGGSWSWAAAIVAKNGTIRKE